MSLLWSLKLAIEKAPAGSTPGVHYIHFNALRTDKAYRTEVIEQALRSQIEEVRTLAQQVISIQHLEDAQAAAATAAADATALYPTGAEENLPQSQFANQMPAYGQAPAYGNQAPAYGQVPPYGAGMYPPHLNREATHRRLSGLTTVGFAFLVIALLIGGYFLTDAWLTKQLTNVEIQGSITQDTVWRSGSTYLLNGLVFVEGSATLSIEPGTRILGNPGSALIVTRDAHLNARGTAEQPIVFTSVKPAGQRARGDWGGVVLLGNAPVNTSVGYVEGIDRADPRGSYGGTNDTESCGILTYVRIEFAGNEISKDNELNGLTLGGCGSGTILRFVQVHMGLDDGIEFFGGSANLSNIVITRADDDGLDWDRGWTGSGQFIVIQQDAQSGDSCVEADNQKKDPNAMPRSAPSLSNVTLIAGGDPMKAQRGMVLRLGTGADLRNLLLAGFSLDAIDVRDGATVEQTKTGVLQAHALVFTDAVGGRIFERETGEDDDDGGFDEEAFFLGPESGSAFIPDQVLSRAAHDLGKPDFTPIYNESLMKIHTPIIQGEFWDEAANYVGAIRPGSRTTWLDGWTAFDNN